MNSIEYMKMAIFEELKVALTVKKVNDEILEYLASSLRWILYYCNKYNMPIPEKEKIIEMMDKAMEIEKKLPRSYLSDESLQKRKYDKSDEDGTELEKVIFLVLYTVLGHRSTVGMVRSRRVVSSLVSLFKNSD